MFGTIIPDVYFTKVNVMDLDDKPIYSDGRGGGSALSVHRNGWSFRPSEMCSLLITATGHLDGVRTFAPRQLNPHCSSPTTSLYSPPLALNANNMAKPFLGRKIVMGYRRRRTISNQTSSFFLPKN